MSDILQTKIGLIKEGYESDLLIIDYVNPSPTTKDNIFSHLFFGLFSDFKPRDVFIAGNHRVINYKVDQTLKQKYLDAKVVASKLWDRIQKEGK